MPKPFKKGTHLYDAINGYNSIPINNKCDKLSDLSGVTDGLIKMIEDTINKMHMEMTGKNKDVLSSIISNLGKAKGAIAIGCDMLGERKLKKFCPLDGLKNCRNEVDTRFCFYDNFDLRSPICIKFPNSSKKRFDYGLMTSFGFTDAWRFGCQCHSKETLGGDRINFCRNIYDNINVCCGVLSGIEGTTTYEKIRSLFTGVKELSNQRYFLSRFLQYLPSINDQDKYKDTYWTIILKRIENLKKLWGEKDNCNVK